MAFDIAARIKQLREERGYSTNKLSTAAGLSQSYVRKLENRESNPTIESLELLCQALEITLIDFLNYENASLRELEVLGLLKHMSDEQVSGLIQLLRPFINPQNEIHDKK